MEGAKERTLHHFGHEHTLEHAIWPSSGKPINCYGCNLRIWPGKDHYTCKTCSFFLHAECSSMPRKTKHPAHPNHILTILVSQPSADNTFNCKACGDGITAGLYYGCAKCGIYLHILCSALPLSLVISSHPHNLKMEFSPPYAFSCDICHKASQKGWLYRCRFCEFDTHVSCAIKDQKLLPANGSNELMKLLVQKFTTADATQHDEGLRSPKGNFTAKNGRIGQPQVKPFTPCSLRSPAATGDLSKDLSILISHDLTFPSYQFSDFCFSIDLLKSSPGQDHPFEANKDSGYQYVKTPPQVEAKIKVDSVAALPNKNLGISQAGAEQNTVHPNVPASNHLFKDGEKRLNKASIASQKEKKEVPNGTGSKPTPEHQKRKPDPSCSSSSSWLKLFTCCHSPRQEKG